MRYLLPLIVSILMMSPPYISKVGASEVVQVTADEWARPRHGEWVVQMASLKQVVETLDSESGVIMIRYPGGEEGTLWAQELVAWLVSLGVSSERIEPVPGSDREDVLDLWVQEKYEQE